MRSRRLHLGFIGGGLSSSIGKIHFISSQLDGRWAVVAGFFSRNKEVNIKTANEWNIDERRTYDSIQKFIDAESNKLDAVVVLSPPSDHYEIISLLVEKKVPIICEKPLAATLEDSLLIQEVLDKSSNFFAMTYNYSGYPMIRELRDLIQNNIFGQLTKIHIEIPQEGFVRVNSQTGKVNRPKKWRLVDNFIPTICLDLGIHLHHLSYFLTGKEPINIMGNFSNYSDYKKIVDDVMVWAEYQDGMKANFWMSKTALGNRNGLKVRIYGTKCAAEWLQTDPENLHIAFKDGTKIIKDRASPANICNQDRYNRYIPGHPSGFIEAFANLYSDIANSLTLFNNGKKSTEGFVYDMRHAVGGMNFLSAISRSNDLKKWVKFNDRRSG